MIIPDVEPGLDAQAAQTSMSASSRAAHGAAEVLDAVPTQALAGPLAGEDCESASALSCHAKGSFPESDGSFITRIKPARPADKGRSC